MTTPHSPGQAKRVLLVSLMKSGTHLAQELMVALGYGMYGQARIPPEIRPRLDRQTRLRVARLVHDDEAVAAMVEKGEPFFTEATDEAWDALAWSWQLRFGMPLVTWYGLEVINTALVEQARRHSTGSDFAQTPAGVCWVFNEFDIKKIDGHFLREWADTGQPKIIFNYRDPRDMLLSMVNFLAGRTGRGFSNFHDFHVFSRILRAKPGIEEQLTYALTDPSFPCHGDDLARAYWLLQHPDVCKISFEEMVGPDGGGSAEARDAAIARVMGFLGVAGMSVQELSGRLFNREAFSFYRGQIGAWREVFTPAHARLAEARFGAMLPLYGYG